MQTPYTNNAPLWDFSMTASGLKHGLEKYVAKLPLTLPPHAHVLDIGCGTGILSFSVLKKWTDCVVLATDIDEVMCEETFRIARRKKISRDRLLVGLADANEPQKVILWRNGKKLNLKPEMFDIIIAGAVMEHTVLSRVIPQLARLLKQGGYFINIAMADNAVGKLYGHIWGCHPIPKRTLQSILSQYAAWEFISAPFSKEEFPANLTRMSIIAQKQ